MGGASRAGQAVPRPLAHDVRITVVRATAEEEAAHEHVLQLLDRASGGNTAWRKL